MKNETFRGKNEIIKTDIEGSGPLSDIIEKVEVLKLPEYIERKNKGLLDKNVFITRQIYDSEHRTFLPSSLLFNSFGDPVKKFIPIS